MGIRDFLTTGWRAAFAAGLLALCAIPARTLAQPVQENTIKAAFVFNFVLFTEWPNEALQTMGSVNVCVNAASDMHEALLPLHGKSAKGLRLKIVPKNSLDRDLDHCHVLYIDARDRANWPAIKKAAANARTLTISDDAGIGRNGAMIALLVDDNRIVFEIDQGAARQSHLSFSSKLLRLAKTLR